MERKCGFPIENDRFKKKILHILHNKKQVIAYIHIFLITFLSLGHLSHSGDLLLWVGVRHRPSFLVRRPLTSSLQEPLNQY